MIITPGFTVEDGDNGWSVTETKRSGQMFAPYHVSDRSIAVGKRYIEVDGERFYDNHPATNKFIKSIDEADGYGLFLAHEGVYVNRELIQTPSAMKKEDKDGSVRLTAVNEANDGVTFYIRKGGKTKEIALPVSPDGGDFILPKTFDIDSKAIGHFSKRDRRGILVVAEFGYDGGSIKMPTTTQLRADVLRKDRKTATIYLH